MPVMVAGVGPRSRLSAGCVAAQSHKQCSVSAAFSQVLPANRGKRKWTRRDSNSWPPPCEGGELVFQRFLEIAKCLQITAFLRSCLSQPFRRFTRVAARLLHFGLSL